MRLLLHLVGSRIVDKRPHERLRVCKRLVDDEPVEELADCSDKRSFLVMERFAGIEFRVAVRCL